jgi:hypothetical protein
MWAYKKMTGQSQSLRCDHEIISEPVTIKNTNFITLFPTLSDMHSVWQQHSRWPHSLAPPHERVCLECEGTTSVLPRCWIGVSFLLLFPLARSGARWRSLGHMPRKTGGEGRARYTHTHRRRRYWLRFVQEEMGKGSRRRTKYDTRSEIGTIGRRDRMNTNGRWSVRRYHPKEPLAGSKDYNVVLWYQPLCQWSCNY